MTRTSLWHSLHPRRHGTALPAGSHHDVVVVGAGLTGLTTAYLLAVSGRSVLVLESRAVGAGTTGSSTAKVSLLQGTVLSDVRAHAGDDLLAAYVEANREGFDWLVSTLRSWDVPVVNRDAWTYAVTPEGAARVAAEEAAARAAGLPVQSTDDAGLPFAVAAGLLLPDQAQVDPLQVVDAIADRLVAAGGTIVTGTRVTAIHALDPVRVRVHPDDERGPAADVTADTVVVATGTPVLDRGLHFARLDPMRSYGMAFELSGPVTEGMYLSADDETRSIRTAHTAKGLRLVIGGEGHVVGRGGSTRARLDRLEAWAREHFPVSERTHAWSAQDYRAAERVPYVGEVAVTGGRVLTATGFNKWGLTNAAAAALALSGTVTGSPQPWASRLYGGPPRLGGLGSALRTNGSVAAHLGLGWAGSFARGRYDRPPAEGAGVVSRRGVAPVARSTVGGRTCTVSAVCTHLGGIVSWNEAEQTWDCPLHGSRFAPDGRRLEGPATRDLAPRPEAGDRWDADVTGHTDSRSTTSPPADGV